MSEQETKETADGGFLNRWSARKRKEASKPQIDDSVIAADANRIPDANGFPDITPDIGTELPATTENSAYQGGEKLSHSDSLSSADKETETATQAMDQEPLLTDADMPSVPSLTAQSDLSVFFNRGVSASLRKAALRHVFSLPIYNVRDGLNDYDDDFTNFEPLGDTITSDMKWHKARKEREAAEAAEAEKAAAEKAAQEAEQERKEQEQALENESSEADEQSQEHEPDSDTEGEGVDSSDTPADTDTQEFSAAEDIHASDVDNSVDNDVVDVNANARANETKVGETT